MLDAWGVIHRSGSDNYRSLVNRLNREDSFQNIAPTGAASRTSTALACGWFLLSVVVLVFLYSKILNKSLDGDLHGWASANVMTQAQSYILLGPWRTHFVPVQNNPPLGSDPDVYLHWPPLLPLVIAASMKIVGVREAAGRIVELAVGLLTAGILVLLGRLLYNWRVGLFTGFFFLSAAATFDGGRVIVQPPLSVMFAVAAVVFYVLAVRGTSYKWIWAGAGIVAVALMVFASWDPLFMPLGLLIAAMIQRDRLRIRLASIYLATAGATFAAIQALYIFSYPALFRDQVATVGYRLGLHFDAASATRLHSIVDQVTYQVQVSVFRSFLDESLNLLRLFSPFVLLAGCLYLAYWRIPAMRRDPRVLTIVGGLGFPWLIWAILMHQYMGIHEFTVVLATPFLAFTTAFLFHLAWEKLSLRAELHKIGWVLGIVLPGLTLYPLAWAAGHAAHSFTPAQFMDLSAMVKENTPADAVIFFPEESCVPVYYSDRHMVRGIGTERTLSQAETQAEAAFPGSPLYLAVRKGNEGTLGPLLATMEPSATLGDSSLYRLR